MAQGTYPPPWNVDLLGRMGGQCSAIEVAGDWAYIGEAGNLTVLDISNSSSPLPIGQFSFNDFFILEIQVEGDIVYLSGNSLASNPGLYILDLTNRHVPRILSFHSTPRPARGVSITDGLAYVACGFASQGGLQIIDVSDPTSPTLLGSFFSLPIDAFAICVHNGIAYMAAYDGLHVFDVRSASQPAHLAVYNQNDCNDVYVADGLAYTGTYSGLEIIDVTSPSAPTFRGAFTRGQVFGVFASDGLVYLAERDYKGLGIVDVANPSSPALIGFCGTAGNAWDVAVSSTTAYLADWEGGLSIIDVTNASSPTLRATYDTLSDAQDIVVADGVAYVANGVRGMKTVNVSDPQSPRTLGSLSTPIPATGVSIVGKRAYVSGFWDSYIGPPRPGMLQIVDVTVPSSPVLLGSYFGPVPFDVAVSNGLAYIAEAYVGLKIVDVRDPSSPTLVGSFETPSTADGVFVSGDVAYVADYTSLQIVDVSDPTAPFLRSSFPGFRITEVFVSNDVAYITGTWSGANFECVDVSDPDNPRLLGKYDVPNLSGPSDALYVSDGLAYFVLGNLRVLDVSDPSKPTLCGFYPTGGSIFGTGLFATGNLVYLADFAGLRILQFTGDETGAGHWRLYR